MKNILLLCVLGLMVTACGPRSPISDEAVNKNLHYFQDKRTHICFAYWDGGPVTAVPCEQVTALIENSWSR